MRYKAREFERRNEAGSPVSEFHAMMDSETPALASSTRWAWIAAIGMPVFAVSLLRGVMRRRAQ